MPSLEQRITELEKQITELLPYKSLVDGLVKKLSQDGDLAGKFMEHGERIAGNSIHILEVYKFLTESVGVADHGLRRRLEGEIS